MIDDAILIEQVSGFPQLYAKNDKSFKDKRAKMNAWETIAFILRATPEACEQRFITLRNKYTGLKRDIKSTPSGSAGTVIQWPHFKAMGFLDPYLHTRRSTSNYVRSERPQSTEWDSYSCITERSITGSDKENSSDEERSTGADVSISESSYSQNSIVRETGPGPSHIGKCGEPSTPNSAIKAKGPGAFKRIIPRATMPIPKKDKKELLTEKLSGCFETLTTAMKEKYSKPADHPENTNSDEHFVKSLVADMSVFDQRQKIILKKNIYNTLADFLETL